MADDAVDTAAATLAGDGLDHAVPVTSTRTRLTGRPRRRPLAKGLEFDRVMLVEPADLVDAEHDLRTGLRRLYVVLTRAVTGLSVVHHRPLPEELAA